MKTTVTVWFSSLPTAAARWSTASAQISGRFPRIDLEPIWLTGSQSETARLKDQSIPLPDVLVGISGAAVANLVRRTALMPLDELVTQPDEFVPEALELGRYNKSLLALPLSGFPTMFYVNQVALEEAGVTLDGTSYADRLDDARRLTDPEVGKYGWGVVPDLPELETVAGSAAGGIWSHDESGTLVGSQKFTDAWQWFADLAHIEGVSPHPAAWDSMFGMPSAVLSGRIAMALQSGWALQSFGGDKASDGTWAIAPLPEWDGLPRHVPFNAAYTGVTVGSQDPTASAEVAFYLATEGLDPELKVGIPTWVPGLEELASSLRMDSAVLVEARNAWHRSVLDTPHDKEVAGEIFPALESVMKHGEPAAEHAPQLATRLASIVKRG